MTAPATRFRAEVLGDPVLSLEMPATPESLPLVRQALTGMAAAVGMGEQILDDVKVAVTEAATNVVLHAYDVHRGPLFVDVWHPGPEVVVRVADEGEGMRPRLERRRPGLGLGLRMIALLAEEMSIATDGERGTRVWMAFPLRDGAAGR